MKGSSDGHWPRREQHVVVLLLVLMALVPPVVHELYPFSAATMFSFRRERLPVYSARALDGQPIALDALGLQLNNPHDPPVVTFGRNGYGRRAPESLIDYDLIPSREEIDAHVAARLRELGRGPVEIRQRILGPTGDGRVRFLSDERWIVSP